LIGAPSRCVTRNYSVDGVFVRIEERRYKDRVIMLTTMPQYMQEESALPRLGQSMGGARKANDKVIMIKESNTTKVEHFNLHVS